MITADRRRAVGGVDVPAADDDESPHVGLAMIERLAAVAKVSRNNERRRREWPISSSSPRRRWVAPDFITSEEC
jgi:hypothetical protein